jgi:hypothetical protein
MEVLMTTERMLILILVAASLLALTRGLWMRKKPAKKGCGNCSGCGCH